jgi:hypothetical protein
MPSYRVTMTIGTVTPGISPARIVPLAAAAARQLTTVEASDVAVVSGAARVTVRFSGEDDAHARRVALHTVTQLRVSATVSTWLVTRRDGGRWMPVSPA